MQLLSVLDGKFKGKKYAKVWDEIKSICEEHGFHDVLYFSDGVGWCEGIA